MELQEKAALLAKYLVVNNKAGKRQGIIVKAEDAPDWVTDVVRVVHGDSFPDDWTYKAIKEAAEAIEEQGEDAIVEADIYTRDLLDWLGNAAGAADYCDEATENYGARDSIMATIQQGQAYAYSEIVAGVIGALELADIDEEEESWLTFEQIDRDYSN